VADTRELAQLFKDGRMDGEKHKAYISRPDEQVPSGFNKVTLPFLDPSQADQHKESLPSVFIAPVGYKVPPGYKGHPLPYDPASLDRLTQSQVTVVHSTDASPSGNDINGVTNKNPFLLNRNKLPKRTSTTVAPVVEEEVQQTEEKSETKSSLFDSALDPSSVVLNKLKLARNRPSLTTFYNKTRSQASYTIVDEENENNKKRKRVLTKVVRKPYNPDTTTPVSVTNEYKTTVVRISNPTAEDELVEFQTRANPSVTTSIPDQSREEETTESHVWTTRQDEQEQEAIEATTIQPVAAVEQEVKSDSFGEPSDQVQTFVTATPYPATPASETFPVSVSTVASINSYEPTPFSNDKFRLKNRKPNHKIFASFPANEAEDVRASEEEVSTSAATSIGTSASTATEKPSGHGLLRNRLNLRKYGFNTPPANSFEANSAANIFGQRIRARKRPTPWTAGFEEEEYQSGATPETTQSTLQTTKKSKAEQYKKKFRPFFDQLYDQLTGSDQQQQEQQEQQEQHDLEEGEEVDEDGVPVRGWARRSTTTPNPFTINAEIYEVHPDSRERITTTKSTTTTTTLPPTTTLPETVNHEYESESRVDDQPEDEVVYVDTDSPALEYVEIKLKNVDSTELPVPAIDLAFEPSQVAQDTNGLVHNEAHLQFGESQRDEDRWNAVAVPPEGVQPVEVENVDDVVATLFSNVDVQAPVAEVELPVANKDGNYIRFQQQFVNPGQDPNSRLHDYEKNIQPQLQHWTEEHFDSTKGHLPVVNEHTQQHMHVNEGDFIPFQPRDPEGPRPAYTEIQRVQTPVQREDEDVNYIHTLVDQAYQLQDVQAPVDAVAHVNLAEDFVAEPTDVIKVATDEEDVTEKSDEATTQVVFVTRPTTTVQPVQDVEAISTVQGNDVEIKITTITPVQDEVEVEPQPEVEAGREEEHEAEEAQVSTQQQDYFEVTTFRPKVTGGFFENFNLGNILGFILPTTTTLPTPTTLPEEGDETTVEVDAEVTTVGPVESDVVAEDKQVVDVPVVVDVDVEVHDVTIPEEDIPTTEPTLEVETTQEVIQEKEELKLETVEDGEAVVPQEATTEENVVADSRPLRFGRPKAIAQPGDAETNPGNDLVQDADTKTSNISKSVYGAIKREEYLKNWVASRKYHKFTDAGNKHGVIIGGSATEEVAVTEDNVPDDDSNANLPFVPTVLPIIDKDEVVEWETSGVSIKKKRRKVNPLLDKLSSSRKSLKDSLFAKSISTTSSTSTSSESSVPVVAAAPEYPRGSDTKVFKQWQGDSLSQAEFERKVLGVSTATEVSVKSVICVRGRCYNADNVPSFFGH